MVYYTTPSTYSGTFSLSQAALWYAAYSSLVAFTSIWTSWSGCTDSWAIKALFNLF